jgi:hypothetical protein
VLDLIERTVIGPRGGSNPSARSGGVGLVCGMKRGIYVRNFEA